MYESDHFDLIAVGTKWIEGCYCLPDAALKNALAAITKQYRYILIDSPGGLEHLNRKIASDVDVIFDVMGPSSKSFAHVRRAHRVVQEVGIKFGGFYVIGGYGFPADQSGRASSETGLPYWEKLNTMPWLRTMCLPVAHYLMSPWILSRTGRLHDYLDRCSPGCEWSMQHTFDE